LRTADGLGVDKVYLTGYTPYPKQPVDDRLPHLARKINDHIAKTALGAEKTLGTHADIDEVIAELKGHDYEICALEQAPNSIKLPDYEPTGKVALIIGREVEGIEPEVLAECDKTLEIPMFGQKESFNVAQAAAMALYHCRFTS
jgi:tRNA G18 (ribose-2'-O)-methylase SpoU